MKYLSVSADAKTVRNLRDRAIWATRLYAIADKIKAQKKLTQAEHNEMTSECSNYLPKSIEATFFIRDKV